MIGGGGEQQTIEQWASWLITGPAWLLVIGHSDVTAVLDTACVCDDRRLYKPPVTSVLLVSSIERWVSFTRRIHQVAADRFVTDISVKQVSKFSVYLFIC